MKLRTNCCVRQPKKNEKKRMFMFIGRLLNCSQKNRCVLSTTGLFANDWYPWTDSFTCTRSLSFFLSFFVCSAPYSNHRQCINKYTSICEYIYNSEICCHALEWTFCQIVGAVVILLVVLPLLLLLYSFSYIMPQYRILFMGMCQRVSMYPVDLFLMCEYWKMWACGEGL